MQNSNRPTARSGSGTQRRSRGIAYTLAGIAAVGAVWLGVSSGTGAEDTAPVAGTQTPTAQQTSGSQPSGTPVAAPEASVDAESPATPAGPPPAAEPMTDGGASPESTEPATSVQETESATFEEPETMAAVQRFVGTTAALNAVSADAAATSDLGALADGAALEELRVQGDEMAVNRWTLDGEAAVDGVKILNEPSSSTEILQVQACIDSSGVALKDENGALIQAKDPSGTRRSLNLYDLEMRDGAWTVVNHYFPDNADC
jgi:hypothetical protein